MLQSYERHTRDPIRTRSFIALAAFAALLVTGCAGGSYTAPSVHPLPNSAVISTGYDEVWDRLVSHASSSFFGIDNFEKDSGLLTLSFGAGDPERYIDCGNLRVSVPVNPSANYNGPWVTYVQENLGAELAGRMNLRVRAMSENQTEVIVNARYVFSVPPSALNPVSYAFAFNSGQSDTRRIPNAIQGTPPTRTCAATGYAEEVIITALKY